VKEKKSTPDRRPSTNAPIGPLEGSKKKEGMKKKKKKRVKHTPTGDKGGIY